MSHLFLFSAFVVATCGLVYELIAGTLASYLLGDSITQFSTVIGVYLFSMGIGSYLSRYIQKNLVSNFVKIEIILGLLGGFLASILFVCFEWVTHFRVLLYSLLLGTGLLVGLEIPLLMKILKEKLDFSDLISKVLAFDYVGALLASLLFPLLLVPHLGLIRSSFLFGIFNVLVALWAIRLYKKELHILQGAALGSLLLLSIGFVFGEKILGFSETQAYQEPILYTKSTPYQRIVLTQSKTDTRLYLNGNLQFSSFDEYRYHEALVHVGLASVDNPESVLILGGGDGLAMREVLKYPSIKKVLLVDLDRGVTELFTQNEKLIELNKASLLDNRVVIKNEDAFQYLKESQDKFDFLIIDFPDPSNFSIGKLYSTTFYEQVLKHLSDKALFVVQSTSPLAAKKSFWCIDNTLKSLGLYTVPYHAYVPSFGEWGFVLVGKNPIHLNSQYPQGLRYLSPSILSSLTSFPSDMRVDTKDVNKLNNQVLVRLFDEEWSKFAQ